MEMEIRNCFRCGKLFVPFNKETSPRFCVECREIEEQEFCTLRDYLRENPSSGIKDIAAETGVEESRIIHYLKEGRLETTSQNCVLSCESCFAPIRTGRYCQECTSKLSKNLTSIYQMKDDEAAVASILTKIQLRGK